MSTVELISVQVEPEVNVERRPEPKSRKMSLYTDSGTQSYLNIRRDPALKSLQSIIKQFAEQNGGTLESPAFVQLFSQTNVLALLFQLFDVEATGSIEQDSFFHSLRTKLTKGNEREFVDLLETVSYVINGESDLNQETFSKVLTSRGILRKLFRLIVDGRGISATVDGLMKYILELTFIEKPHFLTGDQLKAVEENFNRHMKGGSIILEDFKKMMPAKNAFFVERVFQLFDKDGSGSVSHEEFMQSIQQYCSQSTDDKSRFIFQIYDIDGDGLIRVGELKSVLRACMEENGLKFSEEHLDDLTKALYEDANPEGSDGISFEQLKGQMEKHNGLLENMSLNIERWLLSACEEKKPSNFQLSNIWPSKFSMSYVKNNIVFLTFMACYFVVNVVLFATRAADFWRIELPDGTVVYGDYLYMLARGSGRTLHFNGMFILVLMLRRSITFLRSKGFACFLPLDQHVYLHKMVGVVILVLSVFHSIMHVCHFVFIVGDQWVLFGQTVNVTADGEPVFGNRTYTAVEWMFTSRTGTFGVFPGTSSIFGWVLLLIVIVISICSMPFVRKRGNFEVFYWTHLLFVPFWVLLILHIDHGEFWMWIVVPGTIFAIELMIRFSQRLAGKGKTFISSAALLPSRVTHLLIKKPKDFDFQPGDYVFVNIPTIASSEWHPFTISSAPEEPDFISLHIRGVGGWTNRLHQYFENQKTQVPRFSIVDQSNGSPKSIDTIISSKHLIVPIEDCKSKLAKNLSSPEVGNKRSSDLAIKRVKSLRRTYSHHRNQPVIINMRVPSEESLVTGRRQKLTPRDSFAPETIKQLKNGVLYGQMRNDDELSNASSMETITTPMKIIVDGPYGAPSSQIFRAEHAVLIAAGIGVTPFASILQSIMHRYLNSKQNCPNCQHSWNEQIPESIKNLKKVDFFWINREQRSFEWLVNLLTQLEIEQAENSGVMERFLDMHMYITSGLQRTDVKAVGLQLALDLLYDKEHRDLITGLKTRTKTGRPNWDKVFQQLQDQNKGKITVFYCGPPQLGSQLSKKCVEFGFNFRKEIF